MDRDAINRPAVKIFAVVIVVVGFVLTVYLMAGLPAPREQDRIAPVSGEFSIIKPRDWEHRVIYGSANDPHSFVIDLSPPKMVGMYSGLIVRQFRHPPDLAKLQAEGMAPGQFQGGEALLMSRSVKSEFVWRAVMQREGKWYEIFLKLPGALDVPNSDYWPYVTSFRVDPPAALAPATRPVP